MTATAALPLPGGGHRGRRRDVTSRACRPRVCACLLACAIYIASRQPGYQLAIAAELQRMRDGLSDAQSSLRQHQTAVETTARETVAAASELARLMTSNVQTRSWQLAAAALLLLACAIVALCVCATRQPSMRVQLVTLQAREDTTFKQLRALRREIQPEGGGVEFLARPATVSCNCSSESVYQILGGTADSRINDVPRRGGHIGARL